jgi:pimeloyl-ACP methyl ester carboxylesterase
MGRESGVPLILLQNFRQGMDNIDPLLLDGFAEDRPVIIFDNAGVAGSSGETPDTVEAMADHVAAFLGALKLIQVDVLGFSIGGYTAIAFVLRHPQRVRRLLLVGTAPRGQEPRTDPRVDQVAGRPVLGLEENLFLLFSPSKAGQAAGHALWEREQAGWEQRRQRGLDLDSPTSQQTAKAQYAAILEWRQIKSERFAELKTIEQPTLVVNGAHHGPDDQLLDHVAAHSASAADRLSRCRARCALPVPGAVPEAQQDFSGFVVRRLRERIIELACSAVPFDSPEEQKHA